MSNGYSHEHQVENKLLRKLVIMTEKPEAHRSIFEKPFSTGVMYSNLKYNTLSLVLTQVY